MRTRQSPRVIGVAVAVVTALLALAGCGENPPPGAASVVNGHRITTSQVNDLTDAQCVAAQQAAKQGQSQAAPLHRLQVFSLQLLVDTELTKQYGRAIGVQADPAVASALYAQLKDSIDPLPTKARTVLTRVFTDWARGRAILIQAGAEQTGQPATEQNYQQLLDAGLKARESWLKSAEITTNARYGPDDQGFPSNDSGSVSRPVSAFAKQAAKAQPSAAFVSGLPAGQRCG